jgi:hypothetical protein
VPVFPKDYAMIRDGRSTKHAADISRKEMKGPDRFQHAATEAAEWMHQRRKALLVGLGLAVAVLVAAVAADSVVRSRRAAAGGALYQALDAADGEVTTVPLPGLDRQTFKTDADRQRAVIAAAAVARRQHAGTAAGATASLVAGEAHLRLREWDPAAAAFQEYLSAAPAGDAMRFAALDGLARAQEGKGDLEGALLGYERLGQEAPMVKDRAAIEQARVLAKAGKAAEARKRLEAFPTEFKDSPLKPEAQERLAGLVTK